MSIRYLDLSGAVNFWTNIKNYILSKIPTKTSELTNDSGFLTQHQSLSNYVTLNSEQTITGKKLFTNSTTKVNSVNTFTGSTQFIDLSTTVPRGAWPAEDHRVGRVYIGDGTSYNGAWFIVDPIISTNKAVYRMVTTNPDNTDSTRFSITWDSTETGARCRKNVSTGDLLPYANNTYNLGSNNQKWDIGYIHNLIGSNKENASEDANNYYSTTSGSHMTFYTTTNGGTKLSNVPAAVNTQLESRTIRYLSASDWNVEQICHNTNGLYYRKGNNNGWGDWKTFAFTDSNITGTAANVTGTVAIANGGTGATTRLNAVKNLTNEAVGTPTHFLAITTNWGKAGYTTVAQAKTVLGITGDIGSHSDSEYVHKTGDESISGVKSFSNNIAINGTYLGTESSTNERTNIYLLANRDTAGTSGAYISRFRQNRTQGAMESSDFSSITFDFLENSTRYTRCFNMGLTDWDSNGVPQTYYLSASGGKGSLGTATSAWNKVYANSYYLGTTSFTDKFVTTDTAQTINGVKTFNSDTLVSNQGNTYRIANSDGTGYGIFQRHDGTSWYMLVTANNDPLGTWTSARPITIRLSDGYCCINGKANEANKVQATIAANATTALVQATVASNDCFRIAAGGAANAGWAEIATGDDASEPIYVRQYKGNFTTLQRTATLLDGSGNTSFPGTVTATGFSGPLTGDVTGTASKATGNANGNEITDTVIKGLSISGKTITYTKIDGNTGTLTTQDTVYTHPTTSGNKHIPSGGSSGQFLGWDSDGTAKWVNNPNTNTDTLMTQNVSTTDSTYPILLCATANATSNQGAKTGIFGSGVKVNPKTSVVSAKGFSGIPTGNTYVSAVKDGGALVNSQATSWGAIWRAPTKDYQVAGATWSNTNNNVYICYSVTNANAEAGTNTMAKSLIWAADTGTLTTTTFSGALSGNASSATEFSANKDVTLTGDVTGTASSKAGWSVATTLANSGVTAGDYGPSEDASPSHSGTFTVPSITVDAKGRITAASTKTITLPADSNTDTKVTQTVTTGNSAYPVLLCATANATSTGTTTSRFSAGLTVNTRYSSITMTNKYDTANTKGVRNTSNYSNGYIIFRCYDASEMGTIRCESNKNGYQQTYMQTKSYIKNGAIDPEGTSTTCLITVRVRDNGSKTIYTDGSWENSLTPYADNTHSLGTASLKWKDVYANNYYKGTTAFGDIVTHNASEFLTSADLLPIGSYIQFAGSQAPDGFLVCNGGEISRTTYAKLFAVIGTTYGSGDGSTTFNLPNLTDRFLQGSTTSGTVKDAGLPNILGRHNAYAWQEGDPLLGFNSSVATYNTLTGGHTSNYNHLTFVFSASWSNSIYGSSSTVQPPALTCLICIKY